MSGGGGGGDVESEVLAQEENAVKGELTKPHTKVNQIIADEKKILRKKVRTTGTSTNDYVILSTDCSETKKRGQ